MQKELEPTALRTGMLCADARTMYCEHHAFYCDGVFDEACSTACVYASAVRPLVREAFFGANVASGETWDDALCEPTLVCFGQTGSGKTYTLGGLLECIAAELPSCELDSAWRATALEIDGASVRDLLCDDRECVVRDSDRETQISHASTTTARETPREKDAQPGRVVASRELACEELRRASSRRPTTVSI